MRKGRAGVTEEKRDGSMVKRLRHRPFTAVTRVRFPLESFFTKDRIYINMVLWRSSQVVRHRSATPLFTGSNPVCAFLFKPRICSGFFYFVKIFADDICYSDSAYSVFSCFSQKGKAHKILNNFSHFSHKEFLF